MCSPFFSHSFPSSTISDSHSSQVHFFITLIHIINIQFPFPIQAVSPTTSPATTPSKSSHPNGGVGGDHHHHHLNTSTASSSPTSHSRVLSKRLHALSFSKLKHSKTSEAGSSGGKGGAVGVAGSVSSARSDADSSSPIHSLDLEREEFPGGDAMLEVLTRLQTYQESMHMQLQVRESLRERLILLLDFVVRCRLISTFMFET